MAESFPGGAGLAGLAQSHEFAVTVFPNPAGRGGFLGFLIQVKQRIGVRVHHINPAGQLVQNLLQTVYLPLHLLFGPLLYQKGSQYFCHKGQRFDLLPGPEPVPAALVKAHKTGQDSAVVKSALQRGLDVLALQQEAYLFLQTRYIRAEENALFIKILRIAGGVLLKAYVLKMVHLRPDAVVAPLEGIVRVDAVRQVFKYVPPADAKLPAYDLQDQPDRLLKIHRGVKRPEHILDNLCVHPAQAYLRLDAGALLPFAVSGISRSPDRHMRGIDGIPVFTVALPPVKSAIRPFQQLFEAPAVPGRDRYAHAAGHLHRIFQS